MSGEGKKKARTPALKLTVHGAQLLQAEGQDRCCHTEWMKYCWHTKKGSKPCPQEEVGLDEVSGNSTFRHILLFPVL